VLSAEQQNMQRQLKASLAFETLLINACVSIIQSDISMISREQPKIDNQTQNWHRE